METARELGEAKRILEGVEATALSSVAQVLAEVTESLSRTAKDLTDMRAAEWMTAEQAAKHLGCESVKAFEKIASREGGSQALPLGSRLAVQPCRARRLAHDPGRSRATLMHLEGGATQGRLPVAGHRSRVHHDHRHAAQRGQPHIPLLQTPPEACRVAADTYPRPSPHSRDPAARQGCTSQNSSRDARALHDNPNDGHLFSRAAGHAGPPPR